MSTADSAIAADRRGRWIDHWDPEDERFWESLAEASI